MSVHLGAFLHDPLLQALVSELLYCLWVWGGVVFFFRPLPSASPTTQPLPNGTRGDHWAVRKSLLLLCMREPHGVAGCLNVASVAGTDFLF